MRILIVLLLALIPAAAVADGMDQRLAACAACHGAHGEGVATAEYVPHLAGKPAGYLFEQLQAFRDGRRHFAPMVWFVRVADDAWLAEIAAFYAAQAPRSARIARAHGLAPAQAARAQALVQHGDAATGIPACADCHGADLAGLDAGVPALTGLPADYVIAQLGAWRTGARRSKAPDCMQQIATALAPGDLRLLGEWLAAQGTDAPARPAAAARLQLPLACGALPSTAAPP